MHPPPGLFAAPLRRSPGGLASGAGVLLLETAYALAGCGIRSNCVSNETWS